jgi:hypothetical protein
MHAAAMLEWIPGAKHMGEIGLALREANTLAECRQGDGDQTPGIDEPDSVVFELEKAVSGARQRLQLSPPHLTSPHLTSAHKCAKGQRRLHHITRTT